MQTWRVELTPGRKSVAEVKIQRGIFQGDALSPLLYVIALIPLGHILRKCIAGYKLSKLQEKISHLMYTDDINLFAKNEKDLKTLVQTARIHSKDIGMAFGIEKCARRWKRTYQYWRQRWCIDTTTRILHRKGWRKRDLSHQKQF